MDKNYQLFKKNKLFFLINKKINSTGIFLEAMTTRTGGVSRGKYRSLNTGFNTEDNPDNVEENLKRIKNALNIKEIYAPIQVHGSKIKEVTKNNMYKIRTTEADALITREKGIAIGVKVADCVAIIVADSNKRIAAAVHAGWRGTYKKIVMRTINFLQKRYKSKPKDIIASLSPAIGPCHYEVGMELYKKMGNDNVFKNAFNIQKEKIFLDLWEANARLLLKAGLKKRNIFVNKRCIFSDRKLFFSFRRDGKITGRMMNFIMIK